MFQGNWNSENNLYGFGHFQSSDASRVLLLLDLDLHFQGQNVWHFSIFANISETVRDEQTLLSPLDRKSGICNRMVPLRMFCFVTLTYFQGHIISENHIFNNLKTVRANEKYSSTTSIEVDIRYRMAYVPFLYNVTWPIFSRSKV